MARVRACVSDVFFRDLLGLGQNIQHTNFTTKIPEPPSPYVLTGTSFSSCAPRFELQPLCVILSRLLASWPDAASARKQSTHSRAPELNGLEERLP